MQKHFSQSIKKRVWMPWLGISSGQSVVIIYQDCRLDLQSGHMQESTKEYTNKQNNKLFLFPSLSLINKLKEKKDLGDSLKIKAVSGPLNIIFMARTNSTVLINALYLSSHLVWDKTKTNKQNFLMKQCFEDLIVKHFSRCCFSNIFL